MSSSQINTLSSSTGIGYLMPSAPINIPNEEKMLEGILRDKVGSIRRNDHNLGTQWDSQLSYLLSTAVANYEFERIGGNGYAQEEF